MIKNMLRCYVSYSYDDLDRDSLDALLNELKKFAGKNLELIYDFDKKGVGWDINKFMELLNTVEVVLIILTPSYKEKIINRKDCGVYKEYKCIYRRYSEILEKKLKFESYSEFSIIPILFSGTKKNSIPEDIINLSFKDFVGFRAFRNKGEKLIIPESCKTKYKKDLNDIVTEFKIAKTFKSKEYKKTKDKLFDELFLDLREELKVGINYLNFNEIKKRSDIFVKTNVYRKIETQSGYFIIGRKGSGKSAIITFVENKIKNRYKGIISIEANKFNLESLFAYTTVGSLKSDINNIFKKAIVFSNIWELYFRLCTMILFVSLKDKDDLEKFQLERIGSIDNFIKINFLKDGLESYSYNRIFEVLLPVIFDYCLGKNNEFLEGCINNARNEIGLFLSDIHRKATFDNFFKFSVGEKIANDFEEIISHSRRKILITLDGFDTAFYDYRFISISKFSDKNLSDERTKLEIEWLRSLLQLIMKIKRDRRKECNFYKLLDFCITIPKDRFSEIERLDRDIDAYYQRYYEINWSGIELAILLRKRLEVYSGKKTVKELNPEKRLDITLQESFPNIPKAVEVILNSKKYSIPIFLYVLRFTFWRPRDILLHFANIFALAKNFQDKKYNVDTLTIERAINKASYEVIESQFIKEFEFSLTNIKEIISIFRNSKQILSYKELNNLMSKCVFKYAYGSRNIEDFKHKLKILYEIGFLGIEINEEMKDKLEIVSDYAFYFNELISPLLHIISNQDLLENCKFVIHPVFVKYLNLDSYKDKLILHFTWEYLHQMEAFLFSNIL